MSCSHTQRWAAILAEGAAGEGNWIELPATDQSALVAFIAGPGRARATRVRAGQTSVKVRLERPDGSVTEGLRELRDEDIADEYVFTRSYFRDLGLPPPPGVYRWSVLMPPGVGPQNVLNIIEEAANGTYPLESPMADMRASAKRVARAVAALLGVPNPLTP